MTTVHLLVCYAASSKIDCWQCKRPFLKGQIIIGRINDESKMTQSWKHLDCLQETRLKPPIKVNLSGTAKLSTADLAIVEKRTQLFAKHGGRKLSNQLLLRLKMDSRRNTQKSGQRETSKRRKTQGSVRSRSQASKESTKTISSKSINSQKPRIGVRTRGMLKAYRRQIGQVSPKKSPHPFNTLLPPSVSIKQKKKLKKKKKTGRSKSQDTKKQRKSPRSVSRSQRGRSRSINIQPRKSRKTKFLKWENTKPKGGPKSGKKQRTKSVASSVSKSPSRPKAKPKKAKRKAQKPKKQGPTTAQKEEHRQLVEKYNRLSVTELKQLLKKNNMKQSGNKPDLVFRIAGAIMFGYIRLCKACGGGKPNFSFPDLRWECRGFMDDDTFVNCSKKVDVGEIVAEKFVVQ